MTIEVRQMVIKSSVGPDEAREQPALAPEALAELKEEILSECRAWLQEQLQQQRER
jgi:Family of unknown function (DUF5908)